ncbi:MAG: hypothetical protein AAGI30_04685 [Planctomycetota bacterium]
MDVVKTAVTTLAASIIGGSSAAQVLASDSADAVSYFGGWFAGTNGGSGFGPWAFAGFSENADGFVGRFIADRVNDSGMSNVATGEFNGGSGWAIFANGGAGLEQSTAFRTISTPIDAGGITFSLAYEHGFIATGGLVGFSLRNGNATSTAGDFGIGSRLQFFFEGGNGNYTLVDGDGVLDTGIPFGLDGLIASVDFTSADTYVLRVTRFGDELGSTLEYTFAERSLAGIGAVESVALFSSDAGASGDEQGLNNDIYFNSLLIETTQSNDFDLDVNGDGGLDSFDVSEYLDLFQMATTP